MAQPDDAELERLAMACLAIDTFDACANWAEEDGDCGECLSCRCGDEWRKLYNQHLPADAIQRLDQMAENELVAPEDSDHR